MSNTKTLIELIDEYAETRHRCGCATYNAKTEAARKAVIKALGGVQALSAAPAEQQAAPKADGFYEAVNDMDGLYQAAPKAAPAMDIATVGEAQAFEAWYKQDCVIEGDAAKTAAKAAWKARAMLAAEQQATTTEAALGGVYAELPAPLLIQYDEIDCEEFGCFAEGQMRDFADRTHALRMQAAPKAAPVTQQAGYAEVIECGNSYAKVKLKGEAFGSTRVGDILYTALQQDEPVGEVVSASCDHATVRWLHQTSSVGGGDPRNSRAWPKVSGVSRDEGHSRALLVFFAAEPTDDEMRAVHDTLAASPPPTSPAEQQAPSAAAADTVVLEAALRAIHQAIDLIGEPDTERLRTVRRVLRGAVIVAEEAGEAATAPQPAPATQQAGDVVAYLDVGASGYLDLGAALSEDALQQLPKGRHALVIAGTYGIDGYVAAPQPSPTTKPAPQQEAQEPTEIPEEIERMAADRYKVVPSHESMFHRWAIVAGTGTQQLYLGREVECQNMARKFAGAFLDGAFVAMQSTAPQPAPAPLSESIDQLARKLEIIGVVGVVDGHDVVRRESVLEIARRAALAAQGGKE